MPPAKRPASSTRERFCVEALEPRLLYSADLGPSLLASALVSPVAEHRLLEAETLPADSAVATQQAVQAREIVFVDDTTPDAERLIADITSQSGRAIDVVRIGAAEDGLARISAELAARQDVSAVHIISHGNDGAVHLGASVLDLHAIEGRSALFIGWSLALTDDADVLIYGCDVAQTDAGRELLQRLSLLTGADVAASTNATGSAVLGGDWDLEYRIGAIESHLALSQAAQNEWFGLLASIATSGEIQVNTTLAGNQTEASVAMDSLGNFVVVWTADGNLDGNGKGVFAQRFDASGNKLGPQVLVNSATANDQFQASVAMAPNGDYVVVWTSEKQDPDGTEGVYAKRFNAAGVAQGGEFRVNDTIAGNQVNASVAMDASGNFAVVWTSNQNGNLDVFVREFDAAGSPLGAEILVNGTLAGAQSDADVTMDASGNFVVVWTAGGNLDGDGDGIFAQRFSAGGSKLGGEVRVNTTTAKDQTQASVAMNSSGNYIVAWTSDGQDGDKTGVYAQRFNAAGVAQGGEFRVNTHSNNAQDAPSVAIDGAGRFTVAWQSNNQDGSNKGIYAQSYDAGGFTIGSEFRVNATTANAQSLPALAMRGNGDFVVAWQGQSAADSSGVVARTYASLNQAPVNVVPGAQVAGGAPHVFSTAIGNAIQVTDVDAGGAIERVTLTATNGTLTLGQTTGLTFSAGSGTGDATMTFDGTLAAINAALNGMSFTATQFFSGAASVQIVSNDLGFTGAGGSLTDSDTVNITVSAEGTPFIVSGSYTGNFTDNRAITGLGFTPDVVIIKVRDDNKVGVIRTSTMVGDVTKELTGATALVANEIQSLDADGFTIGTHDTVNKLARTYDWIAFKTSPGFLTVGTYTGDGVAGRTVTGLGFSPDALFVFDAANQEAVFTNSAAGGNAFDFNNSTNASWIPSLDANGFTVGVDPRVNGIMRTYHYVAWNEVPGLIDVGSYSGNGVDNRDIAGVGFQPEWVVVKNTAGDGVVQHFDSQGAATDSSSFFTGSAANTNRIQQLQADGFQVGSDNDVNNSGRTYTYMAFRQETAPSISDVPDQSTNEDTPTPAIAFTVGDTETAAGSLLVLATSSNQALVPDANIVVGGSGAARTVTITPAPSQFGTVTITLRVSDGFAAATDTFVLTVNPINDPPTVSAPTEIGVNEDEASPLAGISLADVDAAGGNVEARFTVLQGALSATSGGGVTVAGSPLDLTLTGTLADINAFIAAGNLDYTTALNDLSSVTLEISANDLGNTGAGGPRVSATSSVTLNVTAINDAPVNSVPAAQSTSEDTALVFSAANGNQVSVSDVDAGALEVTLDVTQGTVTLAGTAGLTFSAGDGTADATMTFSGSIASINTAMNGMRYIPALDYSGPASLTITTSDLGNTGQGDILVASDSIGITVAAVNDAPVNSVPGAQSTAANTPIVFSTGNGNAITISDVDALSNVIELTLAVSQGTLTLSGVAGLTFTNGSGALDASMTFSGTLTDVNAALQGLRYDPTPAFSGSDALDLTTSDLGSTGSGGAKVTANTVVINVDFANSAPVLSGANNLDPINEDALTNAGTLVSALIATHVSDIDGGALTGIAVTAVDNTDGTWEYSTNGGVTWTAFGIPSNTAARLLAADANSYVRFVPNADFNGTVSSGLTFRAWDRTSGVAGATADTTSATFTVRDSFATPSYSNNDGSAPWSADWVDSGGGPASGDIRISGGELVLSPPLLLGGGDSILREADLTGATSATLSFSYNNLLGLAGSISLQASGNGGGSYTTLATFSNALNPGAGVFSVDLGAYIANNTQVRFVVNGALLASGSLHVDDVQIAYAIPLNGGTTAFSNATASSSIDVNAVNDAPVLTGANNLSAINEDPATNNGTLVSALAIASDVDSGALTGIAVTAVNNANGTWEYSTDGGSLWSAFGSPSNAVARLLAADASTFVRFVPNADFNGVVSGGLTFRAWDQTNGIAAGNTADTTVSGGTSAFSTATASSGITVNAVNDPPVGTNNTLAMLEDGSYTFSLADFGFTDPIDTPDDSLLAVRITTLPTAGTLTNNSVAVTAGQFISAADITASRLVFAPAANASGTGYATFTFQVQDDGGGADLDGTARAMTIDVTAVNDAPTGTPVITGTVNEDQVLAADTSGIGDVDGLGMFGYQWQRDGVAIGGAMASTYTLGDTDVGAQISVRVSYVDGFGTAEAVVSAQTAVVANINDAPQGTANTVSLLQDGSHAFSASDFGFSDPVDSPPNALLAVRIATVPAAGALTNNAAPVTAGQIVSAADIALGRLVFAPPPGASGAGYAGFTFQVQDDGGTASGGVDFDPSARSMTIDVTPAPVVPPPVVLIPPDPLPPDPPPVIAPPAPPSGGPSPLAEPATTTPVPAGTRAASGAEGLLLGGATDARDPSAADVAQRLTSAAAGAQRTAAAAPATLLGAIAAPQLAAEVEQLVLDLFGLASTTGSTSGGASGSDSGMSLSQELDRMRDELAEQGQLEQVVAGAAAIGGFGLTVGYVLWLLRGGALLASLLSSLPAWRLIDPLPVLSRVDEDQSEDEGDDDDAFESFLESSPNAPPAEERA